VDANLNLALTPINIPNVGTKNGGVAMPHFYWQGQHNRVSSALYALLVSKDIIHSQAKKSLKTISSLHFVTNGFRVIQQQMRMHHPRLANNQAPLFKQVKVACATMSLHIPAGDHVDALMGYFMDFIIWEQQIQMYFESCIIRESECHLLFMQGLAPALRAHVKSQEGVISMYFKPNITLFSRNLHVTSNYLLFLFTDGYLQMSVHWNAQIQPHRRRGHQELHLLIPTSWIFKALSCQRHRNLKK
jgi:hypothetical protein